MFIKMPSRCCHFLFGSITASGPIFLSVESWKMSKKRAVSLLVAPRHNWDKGQYFTKCKHLEHFSKWQGCKNGCWKSVDADALLKRQSYGLICQPALLRLGAKTIKKNTNSTQNKSQTHRVKQYDVTSFLSTDCELSTETCSKNVYSLGPRCSMRETRETALLHVACGTPARHATACMGAKFSCISSCIFIYSTKWPYVKTMNAKIRKNHRFMRMRTRT